MDALEGERFHRAFLCIKAYRYSLYGPYVIHRTFLVKIGQCYVPACLVYLNGRDGCGNLLDQRQMLVPVAFVGMVD